MVNNVDECVVWLILGTSIRHVNAMRFVFHPQVIDHVYAMTLVLYSQIRDEALARIQIENWTFFDLGMMMIKSVSMLIL